MGHESVRRPTFILTLDLPEKVHSLIHVGVDVPKKSDPIFKEVQDNIVKMLCRMMPFVEVRVINMADMADEILTKAYRLDKNASTARGKIVSTSPEITASVKGLTLEVNRIYDENGQFVGLGPRPGFTSLDHQVQSIKMITNGSSIVIVEDGSFTGGTISNVVERFRQAKVEIEAIVIGFAFPKALTRIRECFNGDLIVVEDIGDNIIDWMPDHDFFPLIPNCGRVVGHSICGDPQPLYDMDGFNYSIPYIMPFCSEVLVESWASIPRQHAREFSTTCLAMTKDIMSLVKVGSGEKLKMEHLKRGRKQVSLPFHVGSNNHDFGNVSSEAVCEYLMKQYSRLQIA